jgi:hypothetical protein
MNYFFFQEPTIDVVIYMVVAQSSDFRGTG